MSPFLIGHLLLIALCVASCTAASNSSSTPGSSNSVPVLAAYSEKGDRLTGAQIAAQLPGATLYGHTATNGIVLTHDGVGMNELADLALFKQSSLTKAIDRLERAELVERKHTGRRTLVHLTKRGRHIAAPLLQRTQRDSTSVDLLLGEAKSRELKAALTFLIIRLGQLSREVRPGDGA